MRANRLRLYLIFVLALAAVLSVVGNKADSPFVGWVSFAVFLCALFLYLAWRRQALQERRSRETRTRPDQ